MRAAQLHLDDGQHRPLLGQEVDLALRRLQAEAEDAVALGHQPERRHALAAPAGDARAAQPVTRCGLAAPAQRPFSASARPIERRGGQGRAPRRPRGRRRPGESRASASARAASASASAGRGGFVGRRPITTTISPLGAASAGSAARRRRGRRARGSRAAWSARGRRRPGAARAPRPCRRGWRPGARPPSKRIRVARTRLQLLQEGAARGRTWAAGSRRTGSGRWAGRRRCSAASAAEAPGIGKTGRAGGRAPRAPAGSRDRRPAACRRRRPAPPRPPLGQRRQRPSAGRGRAACSS